MEKIIEITYNLIIGISIILCGVGFHLAFFTMKYDSALFFAMCELYLLREIKDQELYKMKK